MNPFERFDSAVLAFSLLLAMLVAWHVSYAVGAKVALAPGARELGMIQDAVGILLALILAFEFSMASTKFEARDDLAVQHASAIDNCYHRCDLVSAALRTRCKTWLREYAALGVRVYYATNLRDVRPIALRNIAIQRALWTAVVEDIGDSAFTAKDTFVLAGINELSNMNNKRMASRGQFVPAEIVAATLVLCTAWAGFSGYTYGLSANRPVWAWFAFATLVAAFVYVTLDLDRPRGFIRQLRGRAAMQDLVGQLKMP